MHKYLFLLNKLVLCGMAVFVPAIAPHIAHAQNWKPDKVVEIIIGTTPGGPQDRQGRVVQRVLQEHKLVDQTINVVYKPGGGGAVGLAYLTQHKGDAHLMQIVAQSLISNHVAGRSKTTYTDFTPLAVLAVEYVVIVVRVDSPIKDAREFLERMRKDPSAFSMAIGTTIGNATHSSYAHAMKAAGVDIRKTRSIAFNSAAESLTAAMGGHVDAAAGAVSTVLPQIRGGKLRAIVIGAPRRWSGDLSNVPTWQELGVNSAQDLWRGLAGPPGMSAAQIAYWDATLARVVKSPEWLKDLDAGLMANVYKNSAETFKHWQAEYADVKALFTDMGLAK
jgi:putative tricarboxylic transport membrane protein